jgi:hypothetical protein
MERACSLRGSSSAQRYNLVRLFLQASTPRPNLFCHFAVINLARTFPRLLTHFKNCRNGLLLLFVCHFLLLPRSRTPSAHTSKSAGTSSSCCLCATFCCCHAHEHHLLTLPNLQGLAPAAVCVPLFAVATLTNTICSHFQNCRGKLQLLFVGHFLLLPRSRTPSAHTSKTAGTSSSCRRLSLRPP